MSKTFHYALHTFTLLGLITACLLMGRLIQIQEIRQADSDEFEVAMLIGVKHFNERATELISESKARLEVVDNQSRVLRVESDRYTELQKRYDEILERANDLHVANDDLMRANKAYESAIRYLRAMVNGYKLALEKEREKNKDKTT